MLIHLMTVALPIAAADDPVKTSQPPIIKFTNISKGGGLIFEVTNPNAAPLSYLSRPRLPPGRPARSWD